MSSAPRSRRWRSSPPCSSPTTRFAPSPSRISPPPWSCSACRGARSTARARIGGIVHDESATRATVFLEPPEVIELGNALRAAEVEEQREVLQVLRDLTDLLRPHRDAIAAAWEMCVAFDDLCARARYAVEVTGFAPAIGTGPLEIRNGRHPLLLGGEVVVPFDLVLAPDESTVLVSGPAPRRTNALPKAAGSPALLAPRR